MTMNENSNQKDTIRTIITKAVCGRAQQTCQSTVFIDTDSGIELTQILGCIVKNAKIKESKFEETQNDQMNVRVNGEFEIHVWYEADGDTRISKKTVKFSELMLVDNIEGKGYSRDNFFNKTIIPWINKEPVSLGSMIVNQSGEPTISIPVEFELGVEVIGEAKINILSLLLNEDENDEENVDEPKVDENDYEDVD